MIEVDDLIKKLRTNELVAMGIIVPGQLGLEFKHIKEFTIAPNNFYEVKHER
jgi:hypothetical protein